MLQLAVGLLVIALIAGLFGFGFIASSFMAVAQNVANHPIFSNPASNINATNVGVVSSTRGYAPARQIMLRGRIQF